LAGFETDNPGNFAPASMPDNERMPDHERDHGTNHSLDGRVKARAVAAMTIAHEALAIHDMLHRERERLHGEQCDHRVLRLSSANDCPTGKSAGC